MWTKVSAEYRENMCGVEIVVSFLARRGNDLNALLDDLNHLVTHRNNILGYWDVRFNDVYEDTAGKFVLCKCKKNMFEELLQCR